MFVQSVTQIVIKHAKEYIIDMWNLERELYNGVQFH